MENLFDVIIIGGSYAGMSAALSLGRSMRNVLVIDERLPCNRFTPHSHNFLTHDGHAPAFIREQALNELTRYSNVQFLSDTAVVCREKDNLFIMETKSGKSVSAHKLIFASGIKDLLLEIPGFKECWGKSMIHCPYCHGYEFRGKTTALLAHGERGMHLASLISNLTDALTIVTNDENPGFTDEEMAKLKHHRIDVNVKAVTEVLHKNGNLYGLKLADDSVIDVDVAYSALHFVQNSTIPESMGCEINKFGFIAVDNFQRTSIPGIYAAGDCTSFFRSVASAVGAGNTAGAIVNKELTEARF